MPSLINKESFWVVVANEAKIIVYAKDLENDPLEDLFSLENSVAREKMANLITDRGGRSFDSHGEGRHTMTGEKSDPKQHASAAFAKKIAQRVTAATNTGKCRGFALIAAPRFLGVLRDALSVAGNATPVATIDKDVVDQEAKVIDKMLAEHRKG
jgi:protein required for attachment to host cells